MADPYTPAELEAAAKVHAGLWGLPAPRNGDYDMAWAVLAAVLPDHDARVRADERARVAEELLAAGRDPHQNLAWMYPEQAAAPQRRRAAGTDRTGPRPLLPLPLARLLPCQW